MPRTWFLCHKVSDHGKDRDFALIPVCTQSFICCRQVLDGDDNLQRPTEQRQRLRLIERAVLSERHLFTAVVSNLHESSDSPPDCFLQRRR